MNKNTDQQRRQRTSQGHSFREWQVQNWKLESHPVETTSLNMTLAASWTQTRATQLSLHRHLLPNFRDVVSTQLESGSIKVYTGSRLSSRPCPMREGEPTGSDQARRGHKFPPSGGTYCPSEHSVLQSFPRGRTGLYRLTPQLLHCFCPNVLPPARPSADVESKEIPQTLISVLVPDSVTCATRFTNRDVC